MDCRFFLKHKLKIGCLLLLLFPSCTLETNDQNLASKHEKGSNSEKQVYKLRFGHDMPIQSAQHISAVKFSQIVSDKSQGKIQIKVFPNQELGTDQQMIDLAMRGKLDIILPPSSKLSTIIPSVQFLDLPFFFQSREEIYSVLDGTPGKLLLKKLKPLGLTGVTFWESGLKQFTANRAIHSPMDFNSLNVRVMKSKLIMDQFKAMNANPVPIDFHAVKKALENGVVQAQENPLVSIYNMKFLEHQSHLILSNHAYLGHIFCFSSKTLRTFPENIKRILLDSALELTSFEREEIQKSEAKYLKEIKKSGTSIITLSPQEIFEFQNKLKPLVEKYRFEIGSDILESALQILDEKRPVKENEIVIGLDADLTAGSARAGLAIKRGMQLAVEEINNKGGVLGKSLRVLSRDHSGISARGINNIKYFSNVKNLIAIMGGLHSPVALSELEAIHENNLIYLNPWAAATHIVDNGFRPNFVFRISVRDEYAGSFLVNEAIKRNKNRVALLLENTGWGRSNNTAMTTALLKNKTKPVAVEWFNWGEKNMSLQLNRIQAAQADVILLVANAPEGKSIIKTMDSESISIPIISHWGITGGNFGAELKRELNNIPLMFLQTYSFIKSSSKKNQKLVKNYLSSYYINDAKHIIAPVGTAHAYDLVHLLAKAISNSKSFDKTIVRDALENIQSFDGLVKHYQPPFTSENHDALNQEDFFLAKYDEHSNVIPISTKPPALN